MLSPGRVTVHSTPCERSERAGRYESGSETEVFFGTSLLCWSDTHLERRGHARLVGDIGWSPRERLDPPAETSLIVVWADRDRSGDGEAAALSLREKLIRRGISIAVQPPPGPGLFRRVRRGLIWPTFGVVSGSGTLLESYDEKS
jgi:hypothetical protein